MVPTPMGTFSNDTIKTAAALAEDILQRHSRFVTTPRSRDYTRIVGHPCLPGHEDVAPLKRWNRGGGWDPGAIRLHPRFSWEQFYTQILFADIERVEDSFKLAT